MSYDPIELVATSATPADVSIKAVDVQTVITSGARDNHIHKGTDSVHSVEFRNKSRRTLMFTLKSVMPDRRVLYSNAESNRHEREWAEKVKVGGRRDGKNTDFEPARAALVHPADCPPDNGHYADITVKAQSALDDENVAVLQTEEPYTYRFRCTC